MAFAIPFFSKVCFSLSVLLLLLVNFIPDDFLISQSSIGEMSEIRSRLQNGNRVPYNEIDQIPMEEVSHQEQQESVIVPPAVAVGRNEKQEAIVSSPAEVEELLSNEIAVEASPEVASKSSSQSKPINVAPFKTIDFTIVGFSTPFVIYYPLNGAASAKKTAQKFCNENYEKFQLTEQSYNSCVDPIWGEIERVAGEFVKVNLKINSESYIFNINLNDSDSCDYAASDFCAKFVSPDVLDDCKAQVSAKLSDESRLQRG